LPFTVLALAAPSAFAQTSRPVRGLLAREPLNDMDAYRIHQNPESRQDQLG